jgi:DNA modification methylase
MDIDHTKNAKIKKVPLQYFIKDNTEVFIYYKGKNKKTMPILDMEKNNRAKQRLTQIYSEYKTTLPKRFLENWNKVKLFETTGDVENAHAIMLDPTEGSYDINNTLNDLTGKEWTKFSCSWFIFNALSKDIREERNISSDIKDHPATYSPTMMEGFIRFFTKEGMSVLDPFMGIGSTLVGCKRTGRTGYGIELNSKYFNAALKRVPEFQKNMIRGDSRLVKKYFESQKFDFCISSPPYWDILNRSTASFQKTRSSRGLDVKYSNKEADLGNISDYKLFIKDITNIYLDIYDLMRNGAYLVVIVKNIKKGGKLYPLAWDVAKELSKKYALKDEKIWIQDKISLAPYGYPHSWAANIIHHYCLVFKKGD